MGGTTMGRRSGGGTGQEKNCESEGDVPGRVSRYGSDEWTQADDAGGGAPSV